MAGERPRLGDIAQPLFGRTPYPSGNAPTAERPSASARARSSRSSRASKLTDLHKHFVDEVTVPCSGAGGIDARPCADTRGPRLLVRVGLDALRPGPLPLREQGALRGALSRRLHLRGPGPDPRLVLLADRPRRRPLRRPRLQDLRRLRPRPRRRRQEDVQVAQRNYTDPRRSWTISAQTPSGSSS